MIRRIFTRIKRLVDTPDVEELAAYQHKIPHSVKLAIEYDKNTGFYTARVTHIYTKATKNLIITESRTADGLIGMVNDAVLTYLDFPERIKLHMPQLLPEGIDFADQLSRQGSLVLAK